VGLWSVACPVGNVPEIERVLESASYLDLAVFLLRESLGLEPGRSARRMVAALAAYRDRFVSAHLSHDWDQSTASGVPLLAVELDVLSALSIPVGVLHLRYPTDGDDLQRQLDSVERIVRGSGIMVAIENLPDSRNRSRGFGWIRDPARIAADLARRGGADLAACLDTSHAICSGHRSWESEAIASRIAVVHLSDSIPGQDLHGPIGTSTGPALLMDVSRLLDRSAHDGVVVLEQTNLDASLDSLRYLETSGMTHEQVWLPRGDPAEEWR
jgi:sugar phosphate isomerase/epimerase